jgi:hypothetical protein
VVGISGLDEVSDEVELEVKGDTSQAEELGREIECNNYGSATRQRYILHSQLVQRFAEVLHAWITAGFATAHTLFAILGCQCCSTGIGLQHEVRRRSPGRFCCVPTPSAKKEVLLLGIK